MINVNIHTLAQTANDAINQNYNTDNFWTGDVQEFVVARQFGKYYGAAFLISLLLALFITKYALKAKNVPKAAPPPKGKMTKQQSTAVTVIIISALILSPISLFVPFSIGRIVVAIEGIIFGVSLGWVAHTSTKK